MKSGVQFVFLLNLSIIGKIVGQCVIPMEKHTKNSPLLVNPSNYAELLYPANVLGNSSINSRYPFFRLMCPYGRIKVNNTRLDRDEAFLTCPPYTNKFSLIGYNDDQIYDFEAIKCTKESKMMTRMSSNMNSETRNMEAGIKLSIMRFIRTLNFEFQEYPDCNVRDVTVWTKFHQFLEPVGEEKAENVKFTAGSYYRYIRLSLNKVLQPFDKREEVLAAVNTRTNLMDINVTESDDVRLSEGQLISRYDMYYTIEQRATHFYDNIVPMWKSVRDGNWKLVEMALRKFARQLSMDPVNLVAGTLGYMGLLKTDLCKMKPQLQSQMNIKSDKIFVIPRLVFKCISNREGEGIVLITSNNPETLEWSPLEEKTLCLEPVEECIDLYPDFLNITRGYTYCCDLRDVDSTVRDRCVRK